MGEAAAALLPRADRVPVPANAPDGIEKEPVLPLRRSNLLALSIAGIVSLSAPAGAAGPAAFDAAAHMMLTDGVRAGASPDDPAWLRLYCDATELPKTFYRPGEFCFWGANLPHEYSPWRTPAQFLKLRDANIRGVRFDLMWAGVQKESRTAFDYDWYLVEHDINVLVRNGFTVSLLLNSTPYWATGLMGTFYPPCTEVEGESVDLSSGHAYLSRAPVIATEPDVMPVVVTPDPPETVRIEDEIISTDFREAEMPRTSLRPVIPGTEQVRVDENDGRGWVLWTGVEHLVDSPDGAEHYQFDRSGRVKFRAKYLFETHGRTPARGSRIKISYDAVTGRTYQMNVDYTLDRLTGRITRLPGVQSSGLPAEEFDGPGIPGGWQWMNQPSAWDVGQTRPGHLFLAIGHPLTGVGHLLYQTVDGDGDFSASVRVSRASVSGSGQTGLAVYADEQNWFRFSLSTDAGRPLLTRCVNGQVTTYGRSGEIGFLVTAPRWLTVRKNGSRFTVFTSATNPDATDGGYQHYYTFEMPLAFPLRVGVAAAGSDSSGADIDRFLLKSPSIPPGATVRVSYNAMDTSLFQAFCRDVVGRFGHLVKHWEIYNEPDQAWAWRGGQDLYAILLRDAAQAIRETDPEAIVSCGGYSDSGTPHLQTVYNTVGGVFDMAAWHPYLFTNRPPDTVNWAYGGPNGSGRSIMLQNGDAGKGVFLGEVSSSSGVTSAGGGLSERKQAEYALRMFMMARRLDYVQAVQWWPVIDFHPVGVGEDNIWGGHNGLFYNGTADPKPVFHAYRHAASNRGVLLDLAGYDAQGNTVPPGGVWQLERVTVGVRDRSAVRQVRVSTSISATDASARPSRVAARHIGQAGAAPIVVSVDSPSPALVTETWTAEAVAPLSFRVSGSLSGEQGYAAPGQPFVSANGLVSFTIPVTAKPYVAGDRFVFETFAGDGFRLAGVWENDGSEAGWGELEVLFPDPVTARYVLVEFVRAPGAEAIDVDEVRVLDAGGANVAAGKLYLVDGYQGPKDWTAPLKVGLGDARSLPEGAFVTIDGCILTVAREGFAYVQRPDRACGMLVEGRITAAQGEEVSVVGEVRRKPWGEAFISLHALLATGKRDAQPLTCNGRTLLDPMLDGLLVRVFGQVKAGSLTQDSFVLTGTGGPDVRVLTAAPPGVAEGDYITVEGAAGCSGGQRVIVAPLPPPEEPGP